MFPHVLVMVIQSVYSCTSRMSSKRPLRWQVLCACLVERVILIASYQGKASCLGEKLFDLLVPFHQIAQGKAMVDLVLVLCFEVWPLWYLVVGKN